MVAPEGAALVMDDDHVNINGRAREINHLFICSNMACAMKVGWQVALDTRLALVAHHPLQGMC